MFKKYSCLRSFSILLILMLLIAATTLSFAQTSSKINWQRMQRDLDIMESILDRLLSPSSPYLGFWNKKTRGVYFEGYGVVFQVNANGNQMFYISAGKLDNAYINAREEYEKYIELNSKHKKDEPTVVKIISEPEEKEARLSMSERIKELKESLTEFLGDYANAIGQLQKTDRVTILVNFGDGNLFFTPRNSVKKGAEKEISTLEVTAKKSDIIDFRHGRINETAFRNRVVFRERNQDDHTRKNLDIMSNIMDTALSQKYHKKIGSKGKTYGIYLDGLGVLFFMQGNLQSNGVTTPISVYLDELREHQEVRVSRKERVQKQKTNIRELLDEYKNVLLEVVGDYGHTLRTLKPTDHVVVAVDFDRVWGYDKSVPNRFIMNVQKKDLDTYNRGNLKLAEFRQKVKFMEYY